MSGSPSGYRDRNADVSSRKFSVCIRLERANDRRSHRQHLHRAPPPPRCETSGYFFATVSQWVTNRSQHFAHVHPDTYLAKLRRVASTQELANCSGKGTCDRHTARECSCHRRPKLNGLKGAHSQSLLGFRLASYLQKLERVMGIEPTWPAWKAGTLPLSYTRNGSHNSPLL